MSLSFVSWNLLILITFSLVTDKPLAPDTEAKEAGLDLSSNHDNGPVKVAVEKPEKPEPLPKKPTGIAQISVILFGFLYTCIFVQHLSSVALIVQCSYIY